MTPTSLLLSPRLGAAGRPALEEGQAGDVTADARSGIWRRNETEQEGFFKHLKAAKKLYGQSKVLLRIVKGDLV